MSPPSDSIARLLVLYAHYAPTLSYYDDWLDAFRDLPGGQVTTFDLCAARGPAELARLLREHDAALLLHSTNGDTLGYLAPYAAVLAQRTCVLGSFVGNEVNLPGSPLAEKIAFLRQVEPQWIFTQLPLEAGQWLYAQCTRSSVAAVPHALQPRVFRPERDDGRRDIDIGVRTARYIAYLGDDERNALLRLFSDPSRTGRLRIDISTSERFARDDWARFLNRCRGTVINEAGSWYLERDDRTVNAIRDLVLARERARGGVVIAADSPLRKLGHKLPWWLRSALRRLLAGGPVRHEAMVNESVDFQEVYQRFFAGRARAPVYSKAISSRHFDAIGTKTCQIMPRGRFNDILVADEHYLALDADHGNVDSVLERFRDPGERARVTDAAYALARSGHTYAHRVSQVLGLLSRVSP